GQYINPNSNLNAAVAHLKFSPLDMLDAGIIYYNFHFDQTAQFNNPLVTSKNAAQEVDFYSVWSATEWLTVSGVVAFAVPRGGFAGSDVTLSNDGTRTDEADANDDALQDIRVTRRIGSEDGDRGLHEAAAGHRNQWECTETGAAFRAGAIPADRQGEDERHQ